MACPLSGERVAKVRRHRPNRKCLVYGHNPLLDIGLNSELYFPGVRYENQISNRAWSIETSETSKIVLQHVRKRIDPAAIPAVGIDDLTEAVARSEEMQPAIRSSSPSRLPVSVCMATYNGERFVHRQLESILRQLDAEDEVVIVDDCSQDSTLTVVRNLQDSRIRLFEHAENRGPTAAFETALRHARHELICFSDQDDVWLPGKIAHLQTVFENPDVKFAVHDCAVTDGNLKVVEPSYFRWRKVKGGLLRNFAFPGLVGCCMAFRRSLLPIVLPFPSDRRLLHDVWISTAAQVSRVTPVLIPQSLLLFVRHGENASQIDLASRRRTLTRIASERWALLAQLTKHKLFAKRRRDIDRRKGSRLLAE